MIAAAAFRAGAKPRRAVFRRQGTSWFAALCLVLGWLHVWQHRAAHEEDHHDSGHSDPGHFDSRDSDACQLADTPWTDIPAAVCAPRDAAGPPRVARAPDAATGANPAASPPIRAPPHA